MLTTEFEIEELRRAYQLLDVPYSASERAIKQAYRRVTKRWHPDRYAGEIPAHAEATQMMKLINEAYSQIANAPLRHYDEGEGAAARRQTGTEGQRPPGPHASNTYAHNADAGGPFATDTYAADTRMRPGHLGRRIGTGLRFVAGGIFGMFALWFVYIGLRLGGHPVLAIILVIGAFLGGGYAMLRYGNNIRWGRL